MNNRSEISKDNCCSSAKMDKREMRYRQIELLRQSTTVSIILLVLPVLIPSCGSSTKEQDRSPSVEFESITVDKNQVQHEADIEMVEEDNVDQPLSEDFKPIDINDPEAAAYLEGGWRTWGFADVIYGDTAVPYSYYMFKDGKAYEYCVPSMETGEYTTCNVMPINYIGRIDGRYRIKIGDDKEYEDGITFQTNDDNPDILWYYGTWDEEHMSDRFSGTGSLERDRESKYLKYIKTLEDISN